MSRVLLFALLLLPALALPSSAAFKLPDPIEPLATAGFKAMYRHDFAKAEAEFQKITEKMPAHPSGYIFLASMYWWQYSADFSTPNEALEKKFFDAAYAGIDKAKAWKAGGGQNIEADFWLGGAYGLIGRWHISQFEWIRAYLNGKKGYQYLKSVNDRDPDNHDSALGTGEFQYLASRLPGLVRVTALFFVKGDRDAGIRACVEAAEKGTFTRTEAKLFLAVIFNEHIHDYVNALTWMDSLIVDDPDNQYFHMGRAIVNFYKRDYKASSDELVDSIKWLENRPGDPLRDILSMGYYHLGLIALMDKRYDDALDWFSRGVNDKEYPTKGWVTNCLLRRAEAEDLMGRRKEAVADYEAVLKRINFWDSRRLARHHLDKPASFADLLTEVYGDKAVEYERKS